MMFFAKIPFLPQLDHLNGIGVSEYFPKASSDSDAFHTFFKSLSFLFGTASDFSWTFTPLFVFFKFNFDKPNKVWTPFRLVPLQLVRGFPL